MNPPMRMLILLGVFGTAGSLLLAAESPSTPTPKPAAAGQAADAKAADPKAADTKATSDAKGDSKTDTKEGGKGSIADQAEAALKAAAEADPGSAAAPKEPPKSEDLEDDTQAPPASTASKGPSPQRFTPTEQVRADFDVSFPIDI